MPQGLDRFVKGQRQSNSTAFPTTVDLARRAQIAEEVKFKPSSVWKPPGQFQAAPDHRTAHLNVQQSRTHEGNAEGLFAESELPDSEGTTRDFSGYQSTETSQDERNFQDGNGVGHARRPGYTDDYEEDMEGSNSVSNPEIIEDDPDEEDGQFPGFQLPIGTGPMRKPTFEIIQQHVRQFKQSQDYAKAQKNYYHGRSLNTVLDIHPGISGRFTPATNLADDVAQSPTKPDSMTLARHESRPQRNDEGFSDDIASSDSDNRLRQNGFQHGDVEYGSQFDHVPINDAVKEQNSDGRQKAGDRFNGSELESHFEGSGQSSPLERTPRGNGQLNKPNPTSSQCSKRKNTGMELDYEVDLLSSMKYSELKDQPFDSNPRPLQLVVPENLRNPEASLEDRLEYFKGQEPDHQAMLFAQMPLDQWEQSGDWFLDHFSDIMSKLKDARRTKRDVSKAFEVELADREKAVRDRSEGIQEVMRQMRAGGECVLRGRAP